MSERIKHEGGVTIECLKGYALSKAVVVFPNGCIVGFDSKNEWEGDTPYGSFGIISGANTTYHSIIKWLEYWDADRDEKGNLF